MRLVNFILFNYTVFNFIQLQIFEQSIYIALLQGTLQALLVLIKQFFTIIFYSSAFEEAI